MCSGATGDLLRAFYAYDTGYSGGVAVAAGDLNGDGRADVVTGPTTNTNVKAFNGLDNRLLYNFDAYPGFVGGVYVATGDVNGDGKADIITGAGAGGGPQVKVFQGVDQPTTVTNTLYSFYAFDVGYTGGVRVGPWTSTATG